MIVIIFAVINLILAAFVIYLDWDWKNAFDDLNDEWETIYGELEKEYQELVRALIGEDDDNE